MESLSCPICYERFTESGTHEPRVSPCGHTFCVTCLQSLTNRTCAICRNPWPTSIDSSQYPRNLSVVAMLSEMTLISSNLQTITPLAKSQDISEMSSSELLELQETVKKRIIEETRKELIAQIGNNNNEINAVKKMINQRECQITMLRQLISEEEIELSNSQDYLQILEVEKSRLLERAQSEGVAFDLADTLIGEESELHHSHELDEHNPTSIPNHELNESIISRLPPAPPQFADQTRNRLSERERDRRRRRPGQIVPEPILEDSPHSSSSEMVNNPNNSNTQNNEREFGGAGVGQQSNASPEESNTPHNAAATVHPLGVDELLSFPTFTSFYRRQINQSVVPSSNSSSSSSQYSIPRIRSGRTRSLRHHSRRGGAIWVEDAIAPENVPAPAPTPASVVPISQNQT